jgi:hypothetical protein
MYIKEIKMRRCREEGWGKWNRKLCPHWRSVLVVMAFCLHLRMSLASPLRGVKSEGIFHVTEPAVCLTDRRVAYHRLRVLHVLSHINPLNNTPSYSPLITFPKHGQLMKKLQDKSSNVWCKLNAQLQSSSRVPCCTYLCKVQYTG